jgi:type I restriction enzyme S subunit
MSVLETWRGSIPEHWEWAKLNRVAQLGTGHTPDRKKPEYWIDCDIPWVTAADLSSRTDAFAPLLETEQHVSRLGVANSAAVVHPANTVMLCRTASVGLFCVTGVPMATTQAFVTWTPGPRLDARYLLYVIAGLGDEYERLAYGSTHMTIYMPDLEAIRIPLPPIEEQRRIAAFLDDQVGRIDQAIELRRYQGRLTQMGSKLRAERLVEDLGSQFGWLEMRRAILKIEQGWSPDCEQVVATVEEWGVLKVGAVKRGQFRPEQNKRLPIEHEARPQLEVLPGDLLLTRANTPELVGDICVVPDGTRPRLMLCDKIMRISLAAGYLPAFICAAFQTSKSRAQLTGVSTGASSSMVNIRGEDVRSVLVPAAPIERQVRVSEAVSEVVLDTAKKLRLIEASIMTLEERKRSLITAAVTGQLDVIAAQPINVSAWVPNPGVDVPVSSEPAVNLGGI